MINSLGGPVRVNNFLTVLNLKFISNRNLKKMENRAGQMVETVAVESTKNAAEETVEKEMEDVADQESLDVQRSMEGELLADLGVCPLPDEFSSLRLQLEVNHVIDNDSDWTDLDSDVDDADTVNVESASHASVLSPRTPVNTSQPRAY